MPKVIAGDEQDLNYMVRKIIYEKCEYLIVGSDICNSLKLGKEHRRYIEKCNIQQSVEVVRAYKNNGTANMTKKDIRVDASRNKEERKT